MCVCAFLPSLQAMKFISRRYVRPHARKGLLQAVSAGAAGAGTEVRINVQADLDLTPLLEKGGKERNDSKYH